MISVKHYLENAQKSIEQQYGKNISSIVRAREVAKMIYNSLLYRFETREYYYYSLSTKSRKEKKELLPKYYQAKFYYQVNSEFAFKVTRDKWASYKLFKPYYKRDALVYNPSFTCGKGDNSLCSFYEDCDINKDWMSFIAKHNRFIVKPLAGNSGIGIKIFEKDANISGGDMLNQLMKEYSKGFIVEELIQQADEIAKYHPTSVNTLRINTFNLGDRVEIKYPCLRLGRGGVVVDNANSGGIFAAIDKETGRTFAVADEFGRGYTEHPDTKLPLVGVLIPRWNDALDMTIALAKLLPECKVIGWDLALTDEGWVLVEVNSAPLLIYQIASQKGIRKEMEDISRIINK